jgi:hypothetical protein
MIQNFFMKQMLKRQMKGVPQDQQDMILGVIEKNPDFFMKIANDVKEKMNGGMKQADATAAVMKAHEVELKKIIG